MKPKTIIAIMITAIVLFLIASAFSGIKIWQAKKNAAEKARLETLYDVLQKERAGLQLSLGKLKYNNTVLTGEKAQAQLDLAEYKAAIAKKIKDYEAQIAGLKELPADTVYQLIFDRYPTLDGVLKYRFAENQIRNIHVGLVERDQYFDLYANTDLALKKCGVLNTKNDAIINNLGSQNENLTGQNDVLQQQIGIKTDELKLSNKLLNKQKRKAFVYKGTTVVASIGWILFAIK
jgi:hypothetical protein